MASLASPGRSCGSDSRRHGAQEPLILRFALLKAGFEGRRHCGCSISFVVVFCQAGANATVDQLDESNPLALN